MTTINTLSATTALSGGDLLPVWATSNGDTRKASLSLLTDYMQSALTIPGELTTQYSAPSATGFTATILVSNTWLLLTPTGTMAAGSIVLPSSPSDRDVVNVNTTQTITSLTVSAVATVTGAPTTLSANGYFTMRYDAVTATWYRVA